jgi:hypothetical protein
MIDRFDEVEYRVLDCSTNGMFCQSGDEVDRALLLMSEGILVENPISNWWKSGWKLTNKGNEYIKEFRDAVREKHGHEWATYRDTDPDLYKDDDYGNSIDNFAYSYGFHNGFVCKKCGYHFCMHCLSEFNVPECSNKGDHGSRTTNEK